MAEEQDPYANLENANSMLDKVQQITEALQAQGDLGAQASAQWNAAFKDVADQANTAAGNWNGVVDGSKKLKDIQKDISNNKKIGNNLLVQQKNFVSQISASKEEEKQIMDALQSGDKDRIANLTFLTSEQQKLLQASQDGVQANKANAQVLDQQQKAIKESYTATVKGLKLIGDVAGKLGLQGISDAFLDGAEAARQAKLEGAGFFGQMAAAGKEMVLIAAQALLTATIMAALEFNTKITELRTTMIASREEAMAFQHELKVASNQSMDLAVNTKRMQENLMAINAENTFFKQISGENLVTSVKLSEYYGLSAKEIKGISDQSMISGQTQEKTLKSVNKVTSQMRAQKGLMFDSGKIMQQVAQVSGRVEASLGANPAAIAETLMHLEAMGTNLDNINKSQQSLLNFEQSISAELEAELLTGKSLNLERARMAALTNDHVTLAEELNAQVGSYAEFGEMNAIQQQSIAAAIGMSADEMANMLKEQELANLSAQELRDIGEEEMANRKEQKDLQGKFNDLVEKLKIMFVDEIGPFIETFVGKFEDQLPTAMDTIQGYIKDFSEKVEKLDLAKFLEKQTWKDIGDQIMGYIGPIKMFAKIIAGVYLTINSIKLVMMAIKGIQIAMNVAQKIRNGMLATEKTALAASNAVQSKGLLKSIGTAVMRAISSLSAIPFVGFALGVAAGATVAGLAAKYLFAEGGIVPGNDETGDNVPAMVNSGEMILNKEQQANLFAMANQGGGGEGTTVVEEVSSGPAEVVIDSFNMSSYGNLGRMNEKFQNPYLA